MISTSGNDLFRRKLIHTIVENGFEPWLGRSNWIDTAEALGVTPSKARGQYRRLRDWLEDNNITIEEYAEDVMETSSFEVTRVDVKEEEENAFEKLVRASGVDTDLFQVEKGSVWGSTHNMSASFKFSRRMVPTLEQADKMVKRILEFAPDKFEPKPRVKEGHLGIISMYDIQIGRAGFDGTGTEYTVEGYKKVLDELMNDLVRYPIEKILFPLGNDWGNFDNTQGTTTRGTALENDMSWKFSIDEQVDLAVYTVNALKGIAPVDVVMVAGNHDRYSNYFLGKVMEGWFNDCDYVSVDNSHAYRKYYRYGNTGFMLTHGDQENKNMLPAIFAKEGEQQLSGVFSKTKYQEVHMGHYHQRRDSFQAVTEEFGIYVRVLPSLAASSDWESMKAFVLHNRCGIAHVYDKEKGQVAEFYGKL